MIVELIESSSDASMSRQLEQYRNALQGAHRWTVLAIDSDAAASWAWIDNTGTLLTIPFKFLRIVDSRLSVFWRIKMQDDGFLIAPPEFLSEGFLTDALDRDEPARSRYHKVRTVLNAEAGVIPAYE